MVKYFCTQHFYSLLIVCLCYVSLQVKCGPTCLQTSRPASNFFQEKHLKENRLRHGKNDGCHFSSTFIHLFANVYIGKKRRLSLFFRHSNDIRTFSSLQKSYKQFLANFVFNSKKELQKNSILQKNSSKTCYCQFRANDHLRFYFKQYY